MITRPTLAEQQQRAISDLQSGISGATPALRRSILGAIASALAGAMHGLWGYLVEVGLQCTPYSCTWTSAIIGWASVWGLARKPAAVAVGAVTVTGESGRAVPHDTRLLAGGGWEYAIDADDAVIADGVCVVAIRAVDAGAGGNQPAGAELTFVSPLVGVQAKAVVTEDGLGAGADIETPQALKTRLLQRTASTPQGGATHDYVRWATTIPSITRAWCFPTYRGPGSVRVYVVNDDYGGPELASAADVAAAFAYVDSIKPAGVAIIDPEDDETVINGLEVLAPEPTAVDVTISGIADLDVRAKVTSAIAALIVREAAPEAGVPLTRIIGAINNAAPDETFDVTSPTVSPSAAAGHILVPGAITWA